jgi:hypothetical protein
MVVMGRGILMDDGDDDDGDDDDGGDDDDDHDHGDGW